MSTWHHTMDRDFDRPWFVYCLRVACSVELPEVLLYVVEWVPLLTLLTMPFSWKGLNSHLGFLTLYLTGLLPTYVVENSQLSLRAPCLLPVLWGMVSAGTSPVCTVLSAPIWRYCLASLWLPQICGRYRVVWQCSAFTVLSAQTNIQTCTEHALSWMKSNTLTLNRGKT